MIRFFLYGVLVALLVWVGWEAHAWKHSADVRGWRADQAYEYLAEPIARAPDGRPVSRAMVLQALAEAALQAEASHK